MSSGAAVPAGSCGNRLPLPQVAHIHTEGPAKYTNPEFAAHFRCNSMFTGANCREVRALQRRARSAARVHLGRPHCRRCGMGALTTPLCS